MGVDITTNELNGVKERVMTPILLFLTFLTYTSANTNHRITYAWATDLPIDQYTKQTVEQVFQVVEDATCLTFVQVSNTDMFAPMFMLEMGGCNNFQNANTSNPKILRVQCSDVSGVAVGLFQILGLFDELERPDRNYYVVGDGLPNIRSDHPMTFPFSFTSNLLRPTELELAEDIQKRYRYQDVYWPANRFISRRELLELNILYECPVPPYHYIHYIRDDLTHAKVLDAVGTENAVDILRLFPHYHDAMNRKEEQLYRFPWKVPNRARMFDNFLQEQITLLLNDYWSGKLAGFGDESTALGEHGCLSGFCYQKCASGGWAWSQIIGQPAERAMCAGMGGQCLVSTELLLPLGRCTNEAHFLKQRLVILPWGLQEEGEQVQ